ncbi:unnamed protein product [Caenorhabditis bovis]|uniref:RRM domain-containing protein n=1 Tax=Caenorhabditis bovis TaxID=2654633 RepID=A0A8S1FER8_9PELO|nr:unnamed protein product [Caenorhabditis bovis]
MNDNGAFGYYSQQPTSGVGSSVYGEQRPTFSEDGKGTPYTSLLNIVGSSVLNHDISYDTSSKDPHMIRARVFVGNLARAIVTRDEIIELFRPFGKLLAVNYFTAQGFGFVQFAEAAAADKSCLSLNGNSWKSCILDVHLAMLGAVKKVEKPQQQAPVAANVVAAATTAVSNVDPTAPSSKKRTYDDDDYDVSKQNKRNKTFAMSDKTGNEDLNTNEMCDTMICGNCRFVTSDFEEFKDHRIAGCVKYKDPEEPKHRLKCATCSQRFMGAWALLEHLTEFHRMLLFNEEPLQKEPNGQPMSKHSTPVHSEPVTLEGAPVAYSSTPQ